MRNNTKTKNMRMLTLLILILSLIDFHGFSQENQKLNTESINNTSVSIPEDFYLEISDGGNDSYNSHYNSFSRKYSDGNKMINIELTESEKDRIYSFTQKINFYKMPIQFVPKEKIVKMSTPGFLKSIVIYSNGKKKYVSYNSGFTSDLNDKKAKVFLELYEMIWGIINSKEEITKLPKSDYYYE